MDVELVTRAQSGDHDAFTEIASALYNWLRRVALNLVSGVHLAEDATQHSIVEMWRNLPKLREPQKLESWAHRSVANGCRREGRKANRRMQAIARTPEEDPVAAQGFATVAHRDQFERGLPAACRATGGLPRSGRTRPSATGGLPRSGRTRPSATGKRPRGAGTRLPWSAACTILASCDQD